MARTFEYTEKPAGVILGRRGLFKVVGFCAAVVGATGATISHIFNTRNSVILSRQAGLYKDDKLCQGMKLTRSHENEVVMRIYKDMGATPMDSKMYSLLHTHYSQRSMLAGEKHHG